VLEGLLLEAENRSPPE